jgi:hypothetical protein
LNTRLVEYKNSIGGFGENKRFSSLAGFEPLIVQPVDVRKDLRKMGVNNWKQRTQERKKWKEIIEQTKTHKEL